MCEYDCSFIFWLFFQTSQKSATVCVSFCRFRFGAVFLWDSGSSVGDLSGHSKLINSVDIKQNRPYRIVVGSDDQTASFFEGPPFKFKFTLSVSYTDNFWKGVMFRQSSLSWDDFVIPFIPSESPVS